MDVQTYLSGYIDDIKESIKEAESDEEEDDGGNRGEVANIKAIVVEDSDP